MFKPGQGWSHQGLPHQGLGPFFIWSATHLSTKALRWSMPRSALSRSTFIQQSARAWVRGSAATSTGSPPPRAAAVVAPPRAPPPDPGERAAAGAATADGLAVDAG